MDERIEDIVRKCETEKQKNEWEIRRKKGKNERGDEDRERKERMSVRLEYREKER